MKFFNSKGFSIRWKIFAYLILFCALLLILLWLFQTVFLDMFYRSVKINQVNKAVSIIETELGLDSDEVFSDVATTYDVCIEILDGDGLSLYSSDILDDCAIHNLTGEQKVEIVQTVLSEGEIFGYYDISGFRNNKSVHPLFNNLPQLPFFVNNETLLYGKSSVSEDGSSYVILVNSVIVPVDATVKALRIQLVFVSAFMLLLAVILAVIISKKVSGPISRLNTSAKVLALGKYDVSFDGGGFKEMSELSGTLNYAAKELSKFDSLRRDLVANISHDLRTPLTLIKGYSEAMRDLPDENNAENAQIIIDEAERLSLIVNDALDLSKFQSGTQTPRLMEVDFTLLMKDEVERFGKLVCGDGYEITFEYDRPVKVVCDEILLSRVIYNLMINAVNYTGADKKVYVRQLTSDREVTVQVCDTGKGIPEDQVKYIWDKYYKVNHNRSTGASGTGLGLSIVKSILDMHNGKYGARPGPSGGTVFWFTLSFSNLSQNNT